MAKWWVLGMIWLCCSSGWAQKISLRGVPLSIALVQGQGFEDTHQLAMVLWDGERKVLVTGTSRDRMALAQIVALVESEIADGDEEVVVIECTRRATVGDGGQTKFPDARNEKISSLEVEGHQFKGKTWVPL